MGTVAYMSPEQARGKQPDIRTDLFSFGAVLYEMATGQNAFSGYSAADVFDNILNRNPTPVRKLSPQVPAKLEEIINKALEKDRQLRYQNASDLCADLKRVKRDTESARIAAVGAAGWEARAWPWGQRKTALGIVTFVLLALLVMSLIRLLRERGRGIDSVAVLPFVSLSSDPNMEYLSDGITENIIERVSQLPRMKVIARSSVFHYKGREVHPRQVASELGVQAVVTGRILQQGDDLAVSAELVDARDGRHLWGGQYRRRLVDIFDVQEEIGREISEKLRRQLSNEERKRLLKRHTENPEAYRIYLKGRYSLDKYTEEGFRRAIEYFKQALELDLGFALAYAGLSDAYYYLSNLYLPPQEAMPKARAAAEKALELDDTLAEAHASLGLVEANYDWDWRAAEQEYKRAIELNPSYASAHHYYGMLLVCNGRLEEARTELVRAQELDPLSSSIAVTAIWPLYFSRQYDQAIQRLQRVIELDPNFPPAHAVLGCAYEQKGELPKAIAELEKASRLSGSLDSVADLGHTYALAGRTDEARQALRKLVQQSRQTFVPAYGVAILCVGLGEKDQAFSWLEKAVRDHSEDLNLMNVDPRLDSIRSDTRFRDLMRRVHLHP